MDTMHDPGTFNRPGSGRLGRLRGSGRRQQLMGALALVVGGLVVMTLGAIRGVLVLALVWLLTQFLAARRDDIRRAPRLRALTEYAVVAALVAALMTAMPATAPPAQPKAKPKATATEQAADPMAKWRARWDGFVKRVSDEAPVIQLGEDAKAKP